MGVPFMPCPRCGQPIPQQAAFCPHCAHLVGQRQNIVPPAPGWRKVLRRVLPLLILLVLAVGAGTAWYLSTRPQVYDAQGEVFYTGDNGITYQVVLAWPDSHFQPMYSVEQNAAVGEQYRFPVRLYINNVDSDASANTIFLQQVDYVTAEFLPPEGDGEVSCLEPAPSPDYAPDAALVSSVDFVAQDDFVSQMVWTIQMNNGDTIRLRTDLRVYAIRTYDYYPQDFPMDTSEELQALVDDICRTVAPIDQVNVHLPAVTYDESLVVNNRAINFYGTTDGDHRTTFTAPVRLDVSVTQQYGWISYFENIDFRGNGTGVGLSTAVKARTTNCAFSGWKTAVLGYGNAWVNVIGCTIEDNEIGFHFNSTGNSANHSMYNDNLFRGNGTAVLLENVPTELALNFENSVFIENGTDIDNQCDHPLDISEAIFQ